MPSSKQRLKEILEEIVVRTFGSDVIRRYAQEGLAVLKVTPPVETSGVNPLSKRVNVACKDNVSSWEYPHLVICFNNVADLHAAALYLSSSQEEPTADGGK